MVTFQYGPASAPAAKRYVMQEKEGTIEGATSVSWWVERTSKDGRRSLWAIDVDPVIIMVLLGLSSSIVYQVLYVHPEYIYLGPLLLMYLGATFILIAKIPQYRKGIWNSWGTSRMSTTGTWFYRTGYGLLIVGAAAVTALKILHNQAL